MTKIRIPLISVIALCLCMGMPAAAQTPTVVTGTVKDKNGLAYANARVTAQLIPSTASPTVIGSDGIPHQIGGLNAASADVDGNFTMNLFCNSAGGGCSPISPSGTQWLFTVTTNGQPPPLGTGPQSCSATLTITGASQSISGSFSSCPALSAIGGGGAGGQTIYAAFFGVQANAQYVCDAGITNGSTTVTTPATDPPFSAADVGKIMWASNAQCAGEEVTPYPGLLIAQGTITAFNSAHSVTVSNAATAGCTVVASDNCTFVWGSDDTTALTNAFVAATSAPNCNGTMILPAGKSIIQANIRNTAAVTCPIEAANNDAPIGVSVSGQSSYGSMLIPSPTFNTATIGSGGLFTTNYNSAIRNSFHDFGLATFVSAPAGLTGAAGLHAYFNSEIYSIWLLNFWPSQTVNFQAISAGSVSNAVTNVHDIFSTNSGSTALSLSGDGLNWYNSYVQGSNGPQVLMNGGRIRSHENWVSLSGTGGGQAMALQLLSGMTLFSENDVYNCTANVIASCVSTSTGTGNSVTFKNVAISSSANSANAVSNPAGNTLIFDGSTNSVSNNGATSQGINNAGTLRMRNTSASGSSNSLVNSGTVTLLEGNSFVNPISNSGTMQGQQGAGVLEGSCSGVATASSTLGLYGLGQFAATTCTSTVVNLGQVMSKAGTAYALYATATAGGVNASSGVVTALKNGVAQTMTCTLGIGTTCTNGTNSFSYVAGDVISVQFTTQAADTLAGVKGVVVTQ